MGYFNELPDIFYQSPLKHKNTSGDYILIKNIFRRVKLADYIQASSNAFNKYVIGDKERPDTIARKLYNDQGLDFIVILVAGITNIYDQWPLQDYEVYDQAISKYGSEEEFSKIRHYETLEIIDDQNRQILPPNLLVDKDFRIDGTSNKFPTSTRYTIKSLTGNRQLDDKDEYTVLTDGIARAVTHIEFEYSENEKKREINVLKKGYITQFINDMRDIVNYKESSTTISKTLASTENTEVVNP